MEFDNIKQKPFLSHWTKTTPFFLLLTTISIIRGWCHRLSFCLRVCVVNLTMFLTPPLFYRMISDCMRGGLRVPVCVCVSVCLCVCVCPSIGRLVDNAKSAEIMILSITAPALPNYSPRPPTHCLHYCPCPTASD